MQLLCVSWHEEAELFLKYFNISRLKDFGQWLFEFMLNYYPIDWIWYNIISVCTKCWVLNQKWYQVTRANPILLSIHVLA